MLGELESFRNYTGFSTDFPENFRCNLTYYERNNRNSFSDSSLHYIFESENFGFPFFFYKKWPNLGSEM